ncbi:hypothetical protein DPMN_154941 [Dreissena polymorpha]|uniref:Uncharacterized protein n=1 Tax=Dreissena polymorpha TaxID=45954 RepID=A0A9D4FM09_DREPO|nr:hypothetical protein DPMN_154941 [Dreissena polymorpha]
MMQVMRNPQRCRRTDSPSAHCDCAIPSDAGEPIVPLLTATARPQYTSPLYPQGQIPPGAGTRALARLEHN